MDKNEWNDEYSLYSYRNTIKNKEDFYFFDNKISIILRPECLICIKIITSI